MKLPLWFRRQDEDLDEELRTHIQMAIAERIERGEPVDAATRAVRREFGSVPMVKEVTREMWGWLWLEQLWQDVSYAWRICRKAPAFTATAILSMTLGIGANTAIFTLLDAVVFKRLPVSQPEQLVLFHDRDRPGETAEYVYRDYLELRSDADVLAGLAARFFEDSQPVAWNGTVEFVSAAYVSSSYFDVLRIPGRPGRTISPADDSIPANPVVVLGHDFWKRRFASDPNVIGQVVQLGVRPFTIIGIAPEGFDGLNLGWRDDLLIPVTELAGPAGKWLDEPRGGGIQFQLIGRLRPGVTLRQAEAVLTARLQRSHAATNTALKLRWGIEANRRRYLERAITLTSGSRGLPEGLRGRFSGPLLALMLLVLLVLGIACANVANLLLARAAVRQREIEVRVALGAGRARLLRQLLTESVLLAAAGGACGVLVAWASCQWIVATLSLGDGRTPQLSVAPDLRVLGFTVGLSTLTGLLFGLAPVLHAFRRAATPSMRDEAGASGGPAASTRIRRGLIVAQVGLAIVLLATAGLFVRTLWNLQHVETGMDRAHVLLLKVWGRSGYYADVATRNQKRVEVLQRIEAIPGVRAAAHSMQWRFSAGADERLFVENRPDPDPPTVSVNLVTSRYFETLGMPLVRGRTWSRDDDVSPPAEFPAVINQALARILSRDGDPIGRRIRGNTVWFQIVGVVQDARYLDLREAPRPALFGIFPNRFGGQVIYVRTFVEPSAVVTAVQRTLEDSYGLVTSHLQTLDQYTAESISQDRILAGLSGALGAVAALLTAVGLYGVIAYSVARRTREFGIRMALGAGRADILWLVMSEVLALVTAGIVIGLPSASIVTPLARSLLFGISPTDPTTLVGAALLMGTVAALAGYLPANRALASSPLTALRSE